MPDPVPPPPTRLARLRAEMAAAGVDVVLVSVGPELPWLTGYVAMPLERLTMLVVPAGGVATLVVPRLEAPRVEPRPDLFAIAAWDETDDPLDLVAGLVAAGCGRPARAAVGDRTWARFVLGLAERLGDTKLVSAGPLIGPLRAVKDDAEIAALRAAAEAVDGVAAAMAQRPFAGRTEAEVSRELVERMLDAGHQRANFAIVASGPNAASPHHEPGSRVIGPGDSVVCDFGGTMGLYCSDITRTFVVEPVPAEFAELYAVLAEAQERGVAAARVGVAAADVDAAARAVIAGAGYGEFFVHRTGHGIGLEEHEDPYLVAGNTAPLQPGHVFSVEPGIYVPGRFGARIEDIVAAAAAGPDRLNRAPRGLVAVG